MSQRALPPACTLSRAFCAPLQLALAAMAAVALHWLTLRLGGAALTSGQRYGALPPGAGPLLDLAASGLATLPVVALAALWLRDLGGAAVPHALPALARRVLAAWGIVLLVLVLQELLFQALQPLLALSPLFRLDAGSLAALDPAGPLLYLALAQGLLAVVLWTLLLPRALARLSALPAAALRYHGLGQRLLCFALFLSPLAADLLSAWLWSADLILLPAAAPWRLLGILYIHALAVSLVTALGCLAAWRLLRPKA